MRTPAALNSTSPESLKRRQARLTLSSVRFR